MKRKDVQDVFLKSAINAAKNGLHVFPLAPKSKKPFRGSNGFMDATCDLGKIREWWKENPDANIGVRTGSISNIIVIDFDGKIGSASYKKLAADLGDLPRTITVKTPGKIKDGKRHGKGRHFYYRVPDDILIPSRNGIAESVDVRGENGYIVFPPSIHPDGTGEYCFLDEISFDEISFDETSVAELSVEWIEFLCKKDKKQKEKKSDTDIFQLVREAVRTDPHKWHRAVGIDTAVLMSGQGTPCPLGCHGAGTDRLHAATTNSLSFDKDGAVRCRTEDKVYDAIDAYVATGKTATKLQAAQATLKLYDNHVEPGADTNEPDEQVEPGERDAVSGRIVLDLRRNLPSATAFIRENYMVDGIRTLHNKDGLLWAWSKEANCYRTIEKKILQGQILRFLDQAIVQKTRRGRVVSEQCPAQEQHAKNVLSAVIGEIILDRDIPHPCWIGAPAKQPDIDPTQIIFGATQNLYLPTMEILPPSPGWFNLNALSFDYDPDAKCPQFNDFLRGLFFDVETRRTLLEFMGYLLLSDNRYQKALLIIGATRSGKGTLVSIIQKLIGQPNCCSPSTRGMTTNFGLSAFLGKTLAVLSDARFASQGLSGFVEDFLRITGGDSVTIDRKNRDLITTKLLTRFIVLSNVTPRLPDSAAAIAKRFILIQTQGCYYGKENTNLENELSTELPGILNRAIKGLKRLTERGRFIQPEAFQDDFDYFCNLSSPLLRFVKERCCLGPDFWESTENIWKEGLEWYPNEGLDDKLIKNTFFRDLKSAIPEIKHCRKNVGGRQTQGYQGIKLINQSDADDDD